MKCKLGDIANFKNGKKRPKEQGDIPVYGGNGILAYNSQKNFSDCISIGRVGAYCGNVFFVKGDCWISDNAIAAIPKDTVNMQFLYFLLKNLQLNKMRIGSGQPLLTQSILNSIEVDIPNIFEQKKIAHILSILDDKIAINTAINKNLESQAQAIFARYFINIENTPNGWTEGSLTDIAEYLNGLAMQKFRPSNENESLPVLKIKELRQGICDAESDRCSSEIKKAYIVHDGDVIFSWSGSLLVDFWCGGNCGLNQHLFKVTSEKYDKWFYYSWTNYHLQEFIKMAADRATTMGHIKRDALEKARVMIPNQEDYNCVGKLLQPLYDAIITKRIENRKLAVLCDTLLPRLMSGEIDVEHIEM